jgi:polyketide synthase 12
LISDAEGLALLDAALETGRATLVTARLNGAALTQDNLSLPAVLAALARKGRSAVSAGGAAGGDLVARLAGLTAEQQLETLTRVIQTQAAMVLNMNTPDSLSVHRSFRDLGFTSLMALELRNGLGRVLGVPLSAGLAFDYPTPQALAEYLVATTLGAADPDQPLLDELDRLEALLATSSGGERRATILTRLDGIVRDFRAGRSDNAEDFREIGEATDDEIFDLIDKELEI